MRTQLTELIKLDNGNLKIQWCGEEEERQDLLNEPDYPVRAP